MRSAICAPASVAAARIVARSHFVLLPMTSGVRWCSSVGCDVEDARAAVGGRAARLLAR